MKKNIDKEQDRGMLRYIERIIEEKEAEQQIEDFLRNPPTKEDIDDNNDEEVSNIIW